MCARQHLIEKKNNRAKVPDTQHVAVLVKAQGCSKFLNHADVSN